MSKRPTTGTPASFVQLPLIGEVAIYARIATRDKLQTAHHHPIEDLKAYAKALGFQHEQVTVFCDEGTRAATPLLEREGYTELLKAIREGAVNVLFLHTEDRMFHGASELQVNTFIHLCIETGIFIVTPQAVYDLQDLSHIARFRSQCVNAFQVREETAKLMQATVNSRHQNVGRKD